MKWIDHWRIFGSYLLLMRRSLFVTCGSILAGVLFFASYQHTAASSHILIYGVNQFLDIARINLSTGDVTVVGTLGFGTQAADEDHLSNRVYYFDRTDSANRFAYWDPADGSNVIVTTYPSPFFGYPKRLAFDINNNLYLMNAADRLYEVNKNSGTLTDLGLVTGLVTGSLGGTGDIAFAADGTLYLNTYANLYTVDLATNQATLVFGNMFGTMDKVWTGLAVCSGELYGSAVNFETNTATVEHIDMLTGTPTIIFSSTSASTTFNDLTSCPLTPTAVTLSHFQVYALPLPFWWGFGLLTVFLLTIIGTVQRRVSGLAQ